MITLNREIFSNRSESLKVLVPASLYAIQNNLAFYALNNLDPASFQIAYQLKILTTAIFSILIVKKRITSKQWLSLLLLFVGVALVQVTQNGQENNSNNDDIDINNNNAQDKNRPMGFLAVIACCMSSGFSGVYFEKLIKIKPKQSLWIRNFQLAMYCLLISIIAMLYQDHQAIKRDGFLRGYSNTVWLLVFLQAFGGLIVATVVKHADNVSKGFATSISIILSTLVSYRLLDNFDPSKTFFLGALIVIFSTVIYSS